MSTNLSVLLHICCGICAIECINRLKQQNYEVVGFYYNPNIHPQEEYNRRKQVVEKVAEISSIDIIIADYKPEEWFRICENYKNEPENGKRCILCYELRLRKTYEIAIQRNFDLFTTTLTISPHKNSEVILTLGSQISEDKFLKIDFKKDDGFKNTIQLAKKYNLYRQNYCGCIYSLKAN